MTETPIVDGANEVFLESWREFWDLLPRFAKGPAYVYRGQASYDWPLISNLDRLEMKYPRRANLRGPKMTFFESPPLSEVGQLEAFKRAVRGKRGSNPLSLGDDEFWALGQHHGLATPLLDWTRSPFVALFFAFENEKCLIGGDKWEEPEYRGVYMFSTSGIPEGSNDGRASLRVFSPESDSNYRSISQSGLFLWMPRGMSLETYSATHCKGEIHQPVLTKIRIPGACRTDCLVALNKMNINYMTLFPDADGAARYVNSLWQPGHEDLIAWK